MIALTEEPKARTREAYHDALLAMHEHCTVEGKSFAFEMIKLLQLYFRVNGVEYRLPDAYDLEDEDT